MVEPCTVHNVRTTNIVMSSVRGRYLLSVARKGKASQEAYIMYVCMMHVRALHM